MNFPLPDPLSGDATTHNWRQIGEARDALRNLDTQRRSELSFGLQIEHQILRAGEGNFPFKVYLAQIALGDGGMLDAYPDTTAWWRTFFVRSGQIAGAKLSGDGCDLYDNDPDSDFFSNGGVPFQAPDATETFYVWLDYDAGGPSAALMTGTDITADWPTYPVMDESHWLIATINTQTPYQAVIRQYLRADQPLALQAVQVCVGGVWKTMYTPGTPPS